MTHWARDVIGRPWSPGGEGPETFSCWGLVRYAFRLKHGIELPQVTLGEPPRAVHWRGLREAARTTGWRPVLTYRPEQDDVLLMWSHSLTHVGLVERANGGLGVLHCHHARGVVFDPLVAAVAGMGYEVWRRAG